MFRRDGRGEPSSGLREEASGQGVGEGARALSSSRARSAEACPLRHRVWCETVPYDDLLAPAVLALLRRYRLELLLAVRPWDLPRLGAVCARLGDAGVYAALWPMLSDEDGRWASARSRPRFVALVDQALAAAPAAPELVLDLEPAFEELQRWKRWRPWWSASRRAPGAAAAAEPGACDAKRRSYADDPGIHGSVRAASADEPGAYDPACPVQVDEPDAYDATRAAYAQAIARWRRDERGRLRRVTTAVMPMLPFDTRGQWLQRVLGTPADELPVDRHSVMAYTSLFEGWSRGLVGRRRAEWLLRLCARRSHARWGARAGVSLGAVGTGAFGDEPVLRDPRELARDVAIARAAGIVEISLFELGGVLRRRPAEAWLDALCGAT